MFEDGPEITLTSLPKTNRDKSTAMHSSWSFQFGLVILIGGVVFYSVLGPVTLPRGWIHVLLAPLKGLRDSQELRLETRQVGSD